MAKFDFKIEDNVEIPKREVNFGPRESKYPILEMKKGQSFAIQIVGKDGVKNGKGETLTAAEDAKRKAAQKQSYFSSFAKRNGISVVTRYNPETGELRVWHNGAAEVKEEAAPNTPAPAAGSDDMELE